MSRWSFEIPPLEDAERFLAERAKSLEAVRRGEPDRGGMLMAEAYGDAIQCLRRLVPKTTPAEREAVRRYIAERARARPGSAPESGTCARK